MKYIKFTFCILAALILIGSCSKDDNPGSNEPKEEENEDLKEGLVAHYPFDGNTNDISGNSLNGTIVGTASYGSNKYFESGKSLVLGDGTNYINVADNPKLQLKKAMTVYIEFMPMSGSTQCLISKRALGNGVQSFYLTMNYTNPLHFDMIMKDKCSENNSVSDWSFCKSDASSPVLLHCWNYAAAVFDGTSQRVYLNGKLVANLPITFGEMAACSPSDLKIGYWWSSDPNPFKGNLDEVRIYDRALSLSEIQRLYRL